MTTLRLALVLAVSLLAMPAAAQQPLQLYDGAPKGIVPFLRPYRTRDDMSTWTSDPAVQAYVEERLKRGIYRGIGESHFGASEVTAPTLKRFAELAAQHNLYMWCHIDDTTAE